MKVNKIESIWAMTIGLLIILASLAFIVFLTYPRADSSEGSNSIRVIDGDTLQLANGDVVRLICIDTPEKGQSGYTQAKDYLDYIVSNSLNISFVSDSQDKDEYGRLLRYVYADEVFVNKEMVDKGYASVFRYGNDTSKCNEIATR